ncbi:2'-5'-oligoadenylate synthase 3 [Holothuria leucospilota]|uniref:2'-5'-oligoadenylate synthase 3 n=1 Tax=Holothuria leucospilota TaxID=206669 RepID=A0A9Q1BHC2_HOLLE|nr:2'-5'-oligoadenylate synthase 3 [Holothuria leucospilota]
MPLPTVSKMAFSGSLRSFAESLAPDHYETSQAKQAIDNISRAIQAHFRRTGTVDRITPFGSLPKKTSLKGMMDVDMIVYINGQYPPFSEVVSQLSSIVQDNFGITPRNDQFGVYFEYKNVKVDLLAARNFLPPSGYRSEEIQHAEALKHVKSLPPSQREVYSTSLSGASVLFEQSKDSFSHSLSRLAKYWSRKTGVSNVRSLSSVMEYLGAWAAKEWNLQQDMVKGFRHLLEMIISLDSMNVYWTDFYNEHDIPNCIRSKRPLLLDPCNPYNNFMKLRNNEQYFRQMRSYARKTLERIDGEERSTMTFNERFRGFAEDLSPTRNDENRVGPIIDHILQEVRSGLLAIGDTQVNRITPSHRYPKRSDASGIINIDLYIYYDQNPPFTNQICQLAEIISSNYDQSKVTEVGIFFKCKGVNFNLMAARNCLLPEFENPDGDENRVREAQHARALNRVQCTDEDKSLYITSLSCLSVLFEETRDSFSHSLSRLAKYWFSRHKLANKVVDGMRIMEYLGVHSAGEEKTSGDLAKAFSRFLTMMTTPECIVVFWMEYYDSSDIPESVRYQRPLLLDPCNPYNNMFAYGNNAYYINHMKGYARRTLKRLNNAERIFKRSGLQGDFEDMFVQESSCTYL